ncbi:MAG: hypothetical protein JWM74_5735 [Myxococcaceae bacterium]|nr:hypothetical protein [Myxococcaceae bacterium]
MTLSAKWTAVSFLTLATLAVGSVAFAGCTVTSGKTDDIEGGTGNPPVPDSGTPTPEAGGDSAVEETTCAGNKQSGGDFFSHACQQKLNTVCCTELKTCFDIVLQTDPAGARGTDDCNKYSSCIDACTKKADGTPETDKAKISACDDDCDTLTQDSVVNAYGDILKCATDKANSECQ